jgi:YD repeat-containing protein
MKEKNEMSGRLTKLGIVLSVFGLLFFAGAGYAALKVQEGAHALTTFSAAQNVKLTYNDQGQLTYHGTAAGAATIMNLLNNEWGYATNPGDFDPNDPVVNTPSEYMYQMAAISEHTLSSTVTLPADITDANGNIVAHAGDKVAVDGRYYADFNFANPIDTTVRGLAWSPLPLALIGQLGVGAVTASSLQAGIGLAGLFAAVGFMFIFAGLGLVWAARPEKETVPVLRPAAQPA